MPDDSPASDVMDAAHAAIGGVQSALSQVVDRLDTLAATQGEMLQHLIRLEPVKAVETEAGGVAETLDPGEHEPPAGEPNVTTSDVSPLRKLHNVLG